MFLAEELLVLRRSEKSRVPGAGSLLGNAGCGREFPAQRVPAFPPPPPAPSAGVKRPLAAFLGAADKERAIVCPRVVRPSPIRTRKRKNFAIERSSLSLS